MNNSFDVRASVASSHDISAQGKTPAADQTPSGKKAKKKKKEKKEKKEKKKKGDKKKKKHKKDKKVRDDSIAAGEELPAAENTVANASSLTATGSERIHASHSAVDGSLPGPLPKKSQAPKQTEMDRMSASESETTLVARHDRDRLIADDGAARKAAKRKKKDKKLPDPPEASAAALDSPPAGENLQQSFWVFANAGTAGGRAIGQSLLPEIPSLLKTETPAITPGELFEPAAHVRERAETASKGKTRKSNSRERDDEGAAVPASSKTGAKQETNSGATLLPGHNEGWSSVDEAIDAVVKAALKSAEEKEEKPGTEQINPPAGLQQAIVASPSRASDAGSIDLFEEERPKVEGVNSKTTAAKSRKRKLFDEDERMLTSVKKAKSAPSDAAQTTAPPTAASNEEMARFYLATLGLRLNSDGSTSPIKPKKKKAEKKVGKAEKKSWLVGVFADVTFWWHANSGWTSGRSCSDGATERNDGALLSWAVKQKSKSNFERFYQRRLNARSFLGALFIRKNERWGSLKSSPFTALQRDKAFCLSSRGTGTHLRLLSDALRVEIRDDLSDKLWKAQNARFRVSVWKRFAGVIATSQ